MAPDTDEQPVDLDALQAQINMAMAETEELVSSWIQPSPGSKRISGTVKRPKKKSFEEMEKELKEYLRRPPRLGVGAPIPESIGPSAQEEARLKNRLVGKEKKRRRDEGEDSTPNPRENSDEEEEEDRKKGESNANRKKARVDPFGLPTKKKTKPRDNGEQKTVTTTTGAPQMFESNTSPTPITNGLEVVTDDVLLQPSKSNPSTIPLTPKAYSANDLPLSSISSKKKKKQNGRSDPIPEPSITNNANGNAANSTCPKLSTTQAVAELSATSVDKDGKDRREEEVEEEEWTGFGDISMDLDPSDGVVNQDQDGSSSEPGQRQNEISMSKKGKDGREVPGGVPLLNLNGPPPSPDSNSLQSSAEASKKNRRRRRKKHGREEGT